jgi:hypothetical protein
VIVSCHIVFFLGLAWLAVCVRWLLACRCTLLISPSHKPSIHSNTCNCRSSSMSADSLHAIAEAYVFRVVQWYFDFPVYFLKRLWNVYGHTCHDGFEVMDSLQITRFSFFSHTMPPLLSILPLHWFFLPFIHPSPT